MAIDPRIVRIEIDANGERHTFNGLNILASGQKFANPNSNTATVKISNADDDLVNYLISETTPWSEINTTSEIRVYAGRESWGEPALIFQGDVIFADKTQPPDITLIIKAQTKSNDKNRVITRSNPGNITLQRISQSVANDLGLSLKFEANDKTISNYNFTGGVLKQVNKLETAGGVSAYVDDGVLVVKDMSRPLQNEIRVLSENTGLVGRPEITEQGIKVKFLLDNNTRLGGLIRLQTNIDSVLNGDYQIYKLLFNIASRDTPFYWIAEAKRYDA